MVDATVHFAFNSKLIKVILEAYSKIIEYDYPNNLPNFKLQIYN